MYSDWLRAGRSRDRIPVVARFSAPIRTGPGVHPTTCTKGTGSFPGVNSGRGVTLTSHHLLVPWSWKSKAIPILPLWAVRPVQSLSSCTRVHSSFCLMLCTTVCREVFCFQFVKTCYFTRICITPTRKLRLSLRPSARNFLTPTILYVDLLCRILVSPKWRSDWEKFTYAPT
jgi:hypothetical protein